MEFLRSKASRNKASEALYFILNALLPFVILLLVRGFDPPYLAVVVVLLSKWRIIALRPRFWWANIKVNLVDVIVGVGVVGLLYLASHNLTLQVIITLLYVIWQLTIKRMSTHHGIMLQAGISQFIGFVVLFSFSTTISELFVILGCWAVSYVAARHLISNYEERYVELFSSLWGLLGAQLGWIMFYWTSAYSVGISILIPQIALIMMVLGFSLAQLYHMQKHDRLKSTAVRGTILFTVSLIAIILLFTPWDASL